MTHFPDSLLDPPLDEIVVVDNGSTDDSVERIRAMFPEVTVLKNDCNMGFTGGNNIGIRYALAKGAARVLLLNNDTVVSPSFLRHLMLEMDRDPSVGIAGPKIYFYDHPERLWFAGPKRSWLFGCPMELGHRNFGQRDTIQEQGRHVRAVHFLTGCAMLIDRRVFDAVGLLDEAYFAYFEDADYCLRASQAGFKLIYVPTATMRHKDKLPTQGAEIRSLLSLYLGTRNTLVFMRQHGRPIGWLVFIPLFSLKMLRILCMSYFIRGQQGVFRTIAAAIVDFARGKLGPGSINRFLTDYSARKAATRVQN